MTPNSLYKAITYKTKKAAKEQLAFFKKHGMIDWKTGLVRPNLTFELI